MNHLRFLPSQSEPERQLPPHGSYPGILPHIWQKLLGFQFRSGFSIRLWHIKYRDISRNAGIVISTSSFCGLPSRSSMISCVTGSIFVMLLFDFIGAGARIRIAFSPLFTWRSVLLPCLIACHKGCFRLLHGDQKRIVKAVIMKFWHVVIIFVTVAVKKFCQSTFQLVCKFLYLSLFDYLP